MAAFEEVKRSCGTEQIEEFKRHSVFGLEQDDGIAALAIVNMIFRGDGKNNIEQANCLVRHLVPANGPTGVRTAKFSKTSSKRPPVARVLMNPPFSLKRDKEYVFVNHALAQMVQGGLLFSILTRSWPSRDKQGRGGKTFLSGTHCFRLSPCLSTSSIPLARRQSACSSSKASPMMHGNLSCGSARRQMDT